MDETDRSQPRRSFAGRTADLGRKPFRVLPDAADSYFADRCSQFAAAIAYRGRDAAGDAAQRTTGDRNRTTMRIAIAPATVDTMSRPTRDETASGSGTARSTH